MNKILKLHSIFTVIVLAFCTLTCIGANAAYGPGDPEYDLWDRFYALSKTDPAKAEPLLIKLTEMRPDKVEAWTSLTYLRLQMGQKQSALDALTKARVLQPNNETLALQEAYLLNDLGQKNAALSAFEKLSQSADKKTAAIACQATANLRAEISSVLPKPYFADLYASPSFESRFNDAILPIKLRAGRTYGSNNQGQIYGFLSANRDSKSTGGMMPVVIDENAAILGVGINYQPFAAIPIIAYAEVGGSYDLINRNRAALRESIVAGVTGYKEWGDNTPSCATSCSAPLTPYADLYGNVATFSREDYDVLADVRLRGGFNFLKGSFGRLQGYGKLHSVHDTNSVFYNNIFEYGPGLAYHLPTAFPLVLRTEYLIGQYISGIGPSVRGSNYRNTRVELTLYKSF